MGGSARKDTRRGSCSNTMVIESNTEYWPYRRRGRTGVEFMCRNAMMGGFRQLPQAQPARTLGKP